jgi:hypothetical protein
MCASQSLFSHSYVVNEWLNRHCNVQIDIRIRADELGTDGSSLLCILMDSSNYLPLLRSMDSPGQTVTLKSKKFEMDCFFELRPQILKWLGNFSCDL